MTIIDKKFLNIKNMKSININENDIKALVFESIKNILKEGFDSTQIDMFDSSRNGETEVEKSKKLKNAARNKKAAETRADNKRKEKIEALRQFEKDHPESDLFKDDKTVNEAFFNKFKRNPYDHNKKSDEFSTQPLRDGVGLHDIRQRVQEIIRNCNPEDIAIAKKQAMRLYKMVDAMINQGKNVN